MAATSRSVSVASPIQTTAFISGSGSSITTSTPALPSSSANRAQSQVEEPQANEYQAQSAIVIELHLLLYAAATTTD
jgi:hypothetical protein